MKKFILITIILAVVIILGSLIVSLVLSYKVVKPKTDAINKDLSIYFSKIVTIPEALPRPQTSIAETRYYWEMETPSGESTGVFFKFDPGLLRSETKIKASLEIPSDSDPSIFAKVLPAVISDPQSLTSAENPKEENLTANKDIGYQKIEIVRNKNEQPTKITWTYNKEDLPKSVHINYDKLNKFPEPIFKILFAIPKLVIAAFKA